MKHILFFTLILLASLISTGQTKVTKDATGNYTAVETVRTTAQAKETGQYLILKDGTKLAVYESLKGKLYVIRKSKKTGKDYRQYLEVQ